MKQSFRWKVFISFGLFIALIMLLFSGVILYISPPGRVANWTDWKMIGLTKNGWQHQHLIFGFAFALLSLFHLFFINWHAFLSYLKTKCAQGVRSPLELLTVILLSLLFGFGTYFDLQPFSAIIRFGNRISNSWERRETQAPVSHAELMTLIELSAQPALGGDPAALKAKLEKAGLKVSSEHQNLADIAKSNGISAEKAYELLAPPRERKPKLALQGLGNKTLKQIADENGLSSTSLQLALRQKGVEAETNMPLKAIAEKNKIPMGELQQLLELMITH